MEEIRIESKFADQKGEIMVVELGGHIDQSNSYQLEKMFENILQSGSYKIVVDFKDLYYMSSSGWGVFVGEIKRFRENGGDIKLANMNPDIYDVFQMLEFYHILEDYASVEDAAAAFKTTEDILDLVDEENAPDGLPPVASIDVVDESMELIDEVSGNSETDLTYTGSEASAPAASFEATDPLIKAMKHPVKLDSLPLREKIKKVVAQNPLVGPWAMRKILAHERFGYTRIGYFRLRKLLKEMELDSKAKRYRYYRSC